MAKTLTYYVQGSLIDELVERFGRNLESFNKKQLLFLLASVAGDLCCQIPKTSDFNDLGNPTITEVLNRLIGELNPKEKEDLLVAIANQIAIKP